MSLRGWGVCDCNTRDGSHYASRTGQPGHPGATQRMIDAALSAYHRSIVEECCAGSVVGSLYYHVLSDVHPKTNPGRLSGQLYDAFFAEIPIANAPPGKLLEEVAGELAELPGCYDCARGPRPEGCQHRVPECEPPPFAAAWHEGRGEDGQVVRVYQLAAPEGGADIDAISRRYGGRDGRFTVKR
jgi:hypothetical protein